MANNNSKYERKRGHKKAIGHKTISISFSWSKLDANQGQTIDEWEKEGLLSKFSKRRKKL